MAAALAGYVGWAARGIAGGASPWWYVAWAPIAYAIVLFSITSSWFALAWIFRAPRPPDMRIGPVASLRLFWDEARAIARSGPRMALYRWLIPEPDARARARPRSCCCTA